MIAMSAPPASAILAEMPVPAPQPTIGAPTAIWARRRRSTSARGRNGIVVEMATEVLPVVRDMPVLAGVNGTDPFRIMPVFLRQLRDIGFDGIQNFPTVGLIDGEFRRNLEATGMSYRLEIEMIREAHALDLFTSPYVFDPDQARAMAEAGLAVRSDLIVLCHGGPLDEPDQVGAALARMPGINGFFGASSIERLPTERAIRGQVEQFKRLAVARRS